jgi:hypothetical protein
VVEDGLGAERRRLAEARAGTAPWRRWGPHVSLRQWGTVREDYSEHGNAWSSFPHDHARSRAFRWGEDGLGGICDRWQHLCLAVSLWNERDPVLKERLFGLTNEEGNHGEDVKEVWWALDATPTHSWWRWLYRYPQAAFPYAALVDGNRRRSRQEPELELADTGVLDDGRFFDVEVALAKAAPHDLCVRITCTNHGPDAAPLHVLPHVWFRNTWSWGRDIRHPMLRARGDHRIVAHHLTLGRYWCSYDTTVPGFRGLLFTENETNFERLYGRPNRTPFVKDGIGDHVLHGRPTVNPEHIGTKAAAWWRLDLPPGGATTLQLRLSDQEAGAQFGAGFAEVFAARQREADEYHAELVDPGVAADQRHVLRRAVAGLLSSQQYYSFHVEPWLEGDPSQPRPPAARLHGRNRDWAHLANTDVLSMPDGWEYPWYAAWDLAFHMIPMAFVDADFAKDQLLLLCREWYMHPNGQLPAYEWAFGDVNPPVHAWAAWRVYKIDARNTGRPDVDFLERIFHKLLLNFTWWVNRKDAAGRNIFEGGFLGLDNVSVFDRSAPLPGGARLHQADATAWMAMFCLNMLAIAVELACTRRAYEDVATKFFEHFLAIASAAGSAGPDGVSLWDDGDGFFYDVVEVPGRPPQAVRARSIVGLVPLFAVETIEPEVFDVLPDFAARIRWFTRKRPHLCGNVFTLDPPADGRRRMLSLLDANRLARLLAHFLDEDAFLSPHGIRSLSREHARNPVRLHLDGQLFEIAYDPAESTTGAFGGNSNWRGPVWFPLNYLLIESLQKYHHFYGDRLTVELPTGSGERVDLARVAGELSDRLIALFVPGPDGRRPLNGGRDLLDLDPRFAEHVDFPEYFHGDTGAGLGALHQTGWTALVAKLIRQQAREHSPFGITLHH